MRANGTGNARIYREPVVRQLARQVSTGMIGV